MEAAHHGPDAPTEPDPCFARYPVDIMPAEPEPAETGRTAPAPAAAPGRRVSELRTLLAGVASKVIGR